MWVLSVEGIAAQRKVKGECIWNRKKADMSKGSGGKESACNAGDLSSISGLDRSPGEGNGNPLQYFAWRSP